MLVIISRGRWRDAAAAAAKSLQSCPTLCDPIDGSPPGSAVSGILSARTLEWVATAFSVERCYKPVTEEDNFHLGFWPCVIVIIQ